MCRSKSCGGRRCPAHSDPTRRALANAVQRLNRWERRYEAAIASGDETAQEHALRLFTAACEDLTSQTVGAQAPPVPPKPPALDPYALRSCDGADLERMWTERTADRDNQILIEREWARRDLARRSSSDEVVLPGPRYRRLVDQLHVAEELTDRVLKEAWLDGHTDPDLRQLAEAEMDRRSMIRAAHPGDDPDLEDAVDRRLEDAWQSMRPADYRRYESTLVTDPLMRMPDSVAGRRLTDRELRDQYSEFCFERYLAAEAHTRGHLLNRRGKHLGVDPFSLMSGNAKRMEAYASDEFKSFVGSTGGHMSFARFKASRTVGDYDAAHIEEFADAVSA